MKEMELTEPEISTYERAELTIDVCFAGAYDNSSRRVKTSFKRVRVRRVLHQLTERS